MRVHFIAIGGSAMHSLAIALTARGWHVTGSDDRIADPSKSRLLSWGLLPEKAGWHPEKITHDLDAVILGMHARKDNPELSRAHELGLRIYSFPEFLYEQTRRKFRVVIGGSHGKTTITSMILHVLQSTGKVFDYMVGAEVAGFEHMAGLSDSTSLAVFEGDEYPASPLDPRPKFHLYRPHLGLISGIAWDHINVFPTPEDYHRQFEDFTACIEPTGCLIFNQGDTSVRAVAKSAPSGLRQVGYAVHPHAIRDGAFHLLTPAGVKPLKVFGRHNMENLAAAMAVCTELGIEPEEFYTAIGSFQGAARRLETLRQGSCCSVFRDFAHAPSKVQATIQAVKELYSNRRLIACLELHTFSSLNPKFLHQYRGSMDFADLAVVYFDPQTIRHKGLDPLSPDRVSAAFDGKNLLVFDNRENLYRFLLNLRLADSSLLLMSSGDFSGLNLRQLAADLTC